MGFLELGEPKAAFTSSQVWEHAGAHVKPWLLSRVSLLYYLSAAVAVVLFRFFKLFRSLPSQKEVFRDSQTMPVFTGSVQHSAMPAIQLQTAKTSQRGNCTNNLCIFLGCSSLKFVDLSKGHLWGLEGDGAGVCVSPSSPPPGHLVLTGSSLWSSAESLQALEPATRLAATNLRPYCGP